MCSSLFSETIALPKSRLGCIQDLFLSILSPRKPLFYPMILDVSSLCATQKVDTSVGVEGIGRKRSHVLSTYTVPGILLGT